MTALVLIGAVWLGFMLGFGTCAVLSAGKRADEAIEARRG